nr:hypothetical protein [Aureibacillus halotolerans]
MDYYKRYKANFLPTAMRVISNKEDISLPNSVCENKKINSIDEIISVLKRFETIFQPLKPDYLDQPILESMQDFLSDYQVDSAELHSCDYWQEGSNKQYCEVGQ